MALALVLLFSLFFILGGVGHAPRMKKMRTTKPMPMPMPRLGIIKNFDDTRLRVIDFLDDASRFAVASSILKLQPVIMQLEWVGLREASRVQSILIVDLDL